MTTTTYTRSSTAGESAMADGDALYSPTLYTLLYSTPPSPLDSKSLYSTLQTPLLTTPLTSHDKPSYFPSSHFNVSFVHHGFFTIFFIVWFFQLRDGAGGGVA